MNTRKKYRGGFSLLSLLLVVAMLALLAVVAIPKAQAQVTPTTLTNLSGLPAALATATPTNLNHVLNVPQGKVLQVQHAFAANNTTTDIVALWWQPSTDGTNYATYPVNIISFAANGTTGVIGVTNIPAAALEGVRKIKFTVYTNATARTIYPTNIFVGWKN